MRTPPASIRSTPPSRALPRVPAIREDELVVRRRRNPGEVPLLGPWGVEDLAAAAAALARRQDRHAAVRTWCAAVRALMGLAAATPADLPAGRTPLAGLPALGRALADAALRAEDRARPPADAPLSRLRIGPPPPERVPTWEWLARQDDRVAGLVEALATLGGPAADPAWRTGLAAAAEAVLRGVLVGGAPAPGEPDAAARRLVEPGALERRLGAGPAGLVLHRSPGAGGLTVAWALPRPPEWQPQAVGAAGDAAGDGLVVLRWLADDGPALLPAPPDAVALRVTTQAPGLLIEVTDASGAARRAARVSGGDQVAADALWALVRSGVPLGIAPEGVLCALQVDPASFDLVLAAAGRPGRPGPVPPAAWGPLVDGVPVPALRVMPHAAGAGAVALWVRPAPAGEPAFVLPDAGRGWTPRGDLALPRGGYGPALLAAPPGDGAAAARAWARSQCADRPDVDWCADLRALAGAERVWWCVVDPDGPRVVTCAPMRPPPAAALLQALARATPGPRPLPPSWPAVPAAAPEPAPHRSAS